MVTEKMGKIVFTPQEIGELCGLHPNTIRKLIAEKKIPAVHLDRKILISKAALLKWLAGESANDPGHETLK